MVHRPRLSFLIVALTVSSPLTVLVGCKSVTDHFDVDRCATIPCGSVPLRNGAHVAQWQNAQTRSAATDRTVFYDCEFQGQTAEFTSSGHDHVAKIVQDSLFNEFPIVIEATDNRAIDNARAANVFQAFASAGIVLPLGQVLIAKPAARGMDGFRAQQAVRSSITNSSGSSGGLSGQSGSGGGNAGGSGSGQGFGSGGIF